MDVAAFLAQKNRNFYYLTMRKIALAAALMLVFSAESFAEILKEDKSQAEDGYYVRPKSYASTPDSDPPQYVYQLDQTGIAAFRNLDWIDAGLNYRMRFEDRKNDFRRSTDRTDNVFLSRTQAYFGIKNILDPLRFAIELQDSRSHNSKFPAGVGEVNKLDLFQGYAELYFKNPPLLNRPISLRAGRMAYEVLDRKLFSRDDWGNTGTNFQGFRATIGTQKNDWQFDSFALRPMVKKTDDPDSPSNNRWLYAAILNWRKWSDVVTLQPFYFRLDQSGLTPADKRRINSPGLRFYGNVGRSNFDYDLTGIYQFGESNNQTHRAYAYSAELGYSFKRKWDPRASLVYAYASGDKNPNDNKDQRFEKFYGLNRPWSNSNTIEWQNLKTIKSRIEFQPHKKVKMESSYSFYWLASNTDSWPRAHLRDPSGSNGNAIGQDFDLRIHYSATKHLKTTLGYAHFIPGKFARNVGRGGSSDFIYLELTFNVFGNK